MLCKKLIIIFVIYLILIIKVDATAYSSGIDFLNIYLNNQITFLPIPDKTNADADFSIEASSTDTSVPLDYSSSNMNVAIISASGIIHIVGIGTATITVSQPQSNSPPLPVSQSLTVIEAPPPVITPNPGPLILPLDPTGNLIVNLKDIATVTTAGGTVPTVIISPSVFTCKERGPQTITVTAYNTIANPSAVSFSGPHGLVFDNQGNLYIADTYNNLIRKITPQGVVSTVAGNGTTGKNDGEASAASFNNPTGLIIDKAGNIYVTDAGNNKIRKITPGGIVSTYAGSGNAGNTNGLGTAASFSQPVYMAIDAQDNIYVTDQGNNLIRKITPAGNVGEVTTFAGNGNPVSIDGQGTSAGFNSPGAITIDKAGNLYEADFGNSRIRKITPSGNVTFIAGINTGYKDGSVFIAEFNGVSGLAIDANGNLYVVESVNNRIRYIDLYSNQVTTLAGNNASGDIDGTGIAASFNSPFGAVLDGAGNLYITDANNNQVRKLTPYPEGKTSIFAGNKVAGSNNGNIGSTAGEPAVKSINVTIENTLTVTTDYKDLHIDQCTMPELVNTDPNDPRRIDSRIKPVDNCNDNFVGVQSPVAGTRLPNNTIIPVTIRIEDAPGKWADVTFNAIINYTLSPPPTVTISTSTTTACPGSVIEFTANPSDPNVTYQWMVNGNNVGNNQSTYSSSSLDNTDIITCKITSSLPCLTESFSISPPYQAPVSDPITPTISISAFQNPLCEGDTTKFTALPGNAGSAPIYQWLVNGNNAGTNNAEFSAVFHDGDEVSCRITSNADCLVPLTSLPVRVKLNPIPVVTFNSDFTIDQGSSTPLNFNITGNAVSYLWTPATGLSDATIANPIASPSVTTTYTLNAQSADGCNGFNKVTVYVLNPIIVSNTFTPNGDGTNDTWEIPALSAYKGSTVFIYNRNGNLVYHSSGYPKAWDGTYNGSPLPVGTYYYVIDPKNGRQRIAGPVTILR